MAQLVDEEFGRNLGNPELITTILLVVEEFDEFNDFVEQILRVDLTWVFIQVLTEFLFVFVRNIISVSLPDVLGIHFHQSFRSAEQILVFDVVAVEFNHCTFYVCLISTPYVIFQVSDLLPFGVQLSHLHQLAEFVFVDQLIVPINKTDNHRILCHFFLRLFLPKHWFLLRDNFFYSHEVLNHFPIFLPSVA